MPHATTRPGFAGLAQTPEPPYYAVIFTSQRSGADAEHYAAMATRMAELATQQPGYLGAEAARGADGVGITVSYWRSEQDIAAWKAQSEHLQAQQLGNARWYDAFELRVAKVERAYSGPR